VNDVYGAVTLEHLNASGLATGYRSTYMHMAPVLVQPGQYVRRGAILGNVSVTGTLQFGPHLHFHLERQVGSSWEPAMPSPMNGVVLDWCGTYQCITSTNGDLTEDDDGDGVEDLFDNCPNVYNPYETGADGRVAQRDTNGDGWGDACSCSSDAACQTGWYCAPGGSGPPTCKAPACLSDAACPGGGKCVGTGASARCTSSTSSNTSGTPALDCSDVNVVCLIGYEPPPPCPGTTPKDCPSSPRRPANTHEGKCLAKANELAQLSPCWP
jgi:hypothetical protein